jgi:hypothetical protein
VRPVATLFAPDQLADAIAVVARRRNLGRLGLRMN